MLIALYILAGALELAGLLLVLVELREARDRIRAFRASVHVHGRAGFALTLRGSGTAVTSGTPSLEQRVDLLEREWGGHGKQHNDEAIQMREFVRSGDEAAIAFVEQAVGAEVKRLADLVFTLNGPSGSWWRAWWVGPSLIGAGLALGVAGNIVSTM